MVCPIISGTIVERRDQVFTTFFSFRVFSPSTFSRRWPSTNGPFFSERASIPYSSTRRKRPHCARRIFLKPLTGPGTRCDFGQNGHTNRVPCAFGMRSTITAQPGLHSLYRTGSGGGTTTFPAGRSGLVLLAAARFVTLFTGRAVRFAALLIADRRPALAFRVALIAFCSRPGRSAITARLLAFAASRWSCYGLRRLLSLFTSCAGRCFCRCACCCASSYPASGKPRAFADDCPSRCLHRRRAGDPPGSWPRREPSA